MKFISGHLFHTPYGEKKMNIREELEKRILIIDGAMGDHDPALYPNRRRFQR
jgi:5-methyltetrahydrofolate--homocysteine methyltransferase